MEEAETRMIQARDVYVLMKKDYRISRNIRALWFFQHLNKTLQFTPQDDLVENTDELQLGSVVADDGTHCLPGQKYSVALLPSTMVTFMARRYRFVIILDVSPSVSSVDTSNCSVLYEKVHTTLSNFLRGIVLPIPGSTAVLSPEIHITVIAYTPVKSFTFNQVLAQGLVITADNVENILSSMAVKLRKFESTLADNFKKCLENTSSNFANSYYDVRQAHADPIGPQLSKDQDIINNPEAGIVNMIRSGMMALQLLPENSSAGLVVITDGCLGVPDANLFEFLLTQLRTSTIACTFLRVGETRTPFGHFGHIPHTELMQFISTATFGSYFDTCPDVTGSKSRLPNVYHKAMFLWSFQRGLEGFRFDLGDQHLMAQQSSSPAQLVQRLLSHPIHGNLASVMPNIRKRHSESKLNASLFNVLSVRLREGYTIRDIAITKGETQLDVRLVLPWREYARFEYLVRSAWPLDKNRPLTHTEITIEGSYDFLHDMTCTKINTNKMSGFRSANVKKFWQVLQGLSQTDQLLVHLQSFSLKPEYYTLPGSIKEGVPLFYLPLPNSVTPTLSTQLNSKDTVLNQFASFWRPVVNLDIKVWQKWMHTHRIGLVLEHDTGVTKHIHIPSSSSRYTMVLCRLALTSLNIFLSSWSTFVLLDSQSYIRLIYETAEDKTKQKPPSSFVLIRITSKAPCLVLRLAFLGGTPGYQRYELVKELKQKVAELKFPKRFSKSDKERRSALRKLEERDTLHKPPLAREWSEIKCCVLLTKPVESILIRYEKVPHDMTKLEEQATPEVSQFLPYSSQPKNKSAANQFNSLSRYLLHRRWVWTLQQAGVNSISMSGIGRILSTLTKMRIQQGFHFGYTNQGIVNMMVELDMKDTESGIDYTVKSKQKPSCVVQYILFPPYTKTTSDSLSDDDEEMESTEDDGILQIIMECWVEPQHGVAINNTPERKPFEGITCEQIPSVLFPQDLTCISSLLTFEHLSYLCQNSLIPADLASIVNTSTHPGSNVTQLSPTIQHVDFPFELLSLLPTSQQAELIYPTYTYSSETEDGEHGKEANDLLYNLLVEELSSSYHREVTLSQGQSSRFMQHVHSRSRSPETYPFPFKIEKFTSSSDESKTENKSNQTQGNPGLNLSQSQASFKSLGNSAQRSANVSGPDIIKVPEWKCFVKGGDSSSVTLTFIPSTFQDVIHLNESKETFDPDKSDDNDMTEPCVLSSMKKGDENSNKPSEKEEQSDQACNKTSENTQSSPETIEPSAIDSHVSGDEDIEADVANAQPEEIVEPDPEEINSRKPLVVPVYVYDCLVHNILQSLINPWDFQLAADIYQDFTFDSTCDQGEPIGLASPRSLKRVSFSIDSFKDDEEPSWRSSWRSQERRSTEGSTDGGENLWQQCSSLSEMYYNCYVKGVFQSLQKGFHLESQDVDAAINNICEEALPLESNMTTFLHASCCHFQHLVNEARKDQERLSDQSATGIEDIKTHSEDIKTHSVRFTDILDDTDGETQSKTTKIPSVLELPKVTLTFDLSLLHLDLPCEPLKDLHQLIKDKFLDTVQKWFIQVPSSPDYYFYCPEAAQSEGELSDERETTASDAVHGASAGTMPETDGNMAMDTLGLAVKGDRISCTSVLDSEESMEDDVILDLDMTQDDRSDQSPLFINFTCTVKSRLQQYSLSLRNIAVCIGELSTILEKFSEVELSDLKITFDLNCLTLPCDLETPSPRKPSMLRMLSSSSATVGSSSSSDLEDRSSVSIIDMKHLKDPINHLPQRQHDAVTKCMEEIEWLLQDEIVSNLRHISPISTDALNFVAKHIQSSSGLGKANVSVDNVQLQFVFGSEQSNEKFTEEFQKMSFQNYQLNKEAEWYYLSKKRILAFNYVNASMLSSALVELSQWGGKQASNAKACSPSSVSEQTDSKSTKNLSPLIGGAKDKGFDISTDHVGCSSPVTVKSDGTSPSEVKRHSRESSLSFEKRTSSEGLNLENISLINRRRSKELVLKMIKGNKDSSSDREKCRSSGEPVAVDQGKADSPVAERRTVPRQEEEAQNQTDVSKVVDETSKKADEVLQKESEMVVSPVTSAVTSLVDSPSTGSATFSISGTGSHVTSAVQSPVISDVSIQLTKTDGRCEPFRTSPERACTNPSMVDDSFDSTDLENEAVLKRCSSFAGFRSQEPCVPTKQDPETEFQGPSPLKPYHHSLIGPQGRSRHCSAPVSGQGTPRSKVSQLPYTPSCISSRGSFTEDGASYDGDMSEMDDSATMFSESGVVTRLMPNFWLIMHINFNGVDINNIEMNTVDILFQHRETGKETNEETLELRNLLLQVKSNVETTCRRVNQQLLLNDLYESRMCHNLLVDAAEEEVSWKLDRRIKPRHGLNVSSSENDDDDDDDDAFERKYLAAAMNLDPGYFDCKSVWQTKFYIHPGLKRGAGRGSTMSIGIKALRSVLNPLSVNNRNNMFVFKETTTDNVYYLRLKEVQSSSLRSAMVAEDSQDSLSMSGGLKPPEQDADTVSICSSNSTLSLSQSQKVVPQDCVELTVHGIDDAGKEIKEDLVQMLQKKLDEATLDKISEMLRRNPQCQLDSHDVQFIQKPGLEPAKILHLTVSNRASPQLAAVMYYLRQNLLQFLHPPKYKSSLAEHQFMDTFDGKLTSIPTDQSFLYIPPHTARKTGISVISICLVDGQGNQVRLLQCPKPSSLAYLDIDTKLDLESFVLTQTFEIQPNSKGPGPTALIQFHIWQVGDVDIPVLQEKLTLALKYALCDVVMEYHMLTAPLCTVPKHLVDLLPTPPTYSAPTSPFHSMPGEEFRERKLSMVLKKPSDSQRGLDRRASLQNPSRFQALKDAFIHSSKKVMSPTPDSNKDAAVRCKYCHYRFLELSEAIEHVLKCHPQRKIVFELPGYDSGTGSKASSPMPDRVGSPHRPDPGNIVNQYENGDRGTLHKMYSDLMEDWLIFCSQLETPSVNKLNLTLKSRFSVDYVLQEFQHMVSRLSQTMSTKVYKMLPKEEVDEDSNIGVLYVPNRTPFEPGRRKSETSLDNCRPMTLTPGVDRNFTAVSRDLEQWYTFVHHPYEEDENSEQSSSVKAKHSSQKFAAHVPSATESKTFGMFSESTSLIPRQRFLLLSLKNKQVWLYAYNLTNDAFSSLSKHLIKLVQWNNCRTHLLSNVVTQKCGLFNHYLYGEASCNMEKLVQQMDSVDQLINHPAPPPPNKEKLARTQSTSSVRETYLPFDVTFKDLYPNKPLHVSYLACHTDFVKQYGQQAQDIRLDHKRQFDKIHNISRLYVMWVQKMAPNYPISEAIMRQLKQASRLFHYCATPLLFSAKWRKRVLEKYKVTQQDSQNVAVSTNTPDTKTRSRHGSGASTGSVRTKRTDSNELKKRPSLQTFKEYQSDSEDTSGEEEWHLELRSTFIYQYIKYLQTVGFHYVQMDKSQDKGKVKKRSGMPSEDTSSQEIEIKATETHNLQKTVSGGVLLIEISFRNEYFCVKLFTCDHNKLGITVNQQKNEIEDIPITQELNLLFVDECEKCKHVIHVHSFAHDFHLRCIQSYISGQHDIFKPGYYMSGLLNDFVKVYAYAPSFSRNFLQREVVCIPKPSCSSKDLYEYMLQHAKLHQMSMLKMTLPPEVDNALDVSSKNHEHALISHEVREVSATDAKSTSPKKMETYNIGLVILQDCPTLGSGGGQAGGGTADPPLKLQFYMILTSSETLFPRQTLDRERGVILSRSQSTGEKRISGDLKDQITVKKSASVREQSTNYLGFSNKHQPPMYKLLQKEAVIVRDKIEKMAVASMEKCRRDALWTRMLFSKGDETKKKSDMDSSRDLEKLTFEEFQEMLNRVHNVPLYEMDPRLVPFVHMSTAWYQGLAHVLNNSYTDYFKRCFINPENNAEQHHIIINPKFLDLFMMLSVDSASRKTGLYAVFRKPAKEQESICPGGQNLPEQSVQGHMEQFINTCCFHMWSSML